MLRPALSIVFLLAVATPATARLRDPDPAAQRLQGALNSLDASGKGYVTLGDFLRGRPFAGRLFSALDRNGDGTLDRREFSARQDARRATEFARLDRRRNGRVTHDEFLRGWNQDLFDALSDGRGYLTGADLRSDFSSGYGPASRPSSAPPPTSPAAQGHFAPGDPRNVCWVPPRLRGGPGFGMAWPWSADCPGQQGKN